MPTIAPNARGATTRRRRRTLNWLRGLRRLRGERGWCEVWATLSPTTPPRVQMLCIRSILPPNDALHDAARRLAALTARPIRRELDRLLAATCDRDDIWRQLRLAHLAYGHCAIKDLVSGDGASMPPSALKEMDESCCWNYTPMRAANCSASLSSRKPATGSRQAITDGLAAPARRATMLITGLTTGFALCCVANTM